MAFSLVPKWHGSVAIGGETWAITSWSDDVIVPAGGNKRWLIDLVNDDMDEQTIVVELPGQRVEPHWPFDSGPSPPGEVATVVASGRCWRVREWTFVEDGGDEHHTLNIDTPDGEGDRASSVLRITIPTPDSRRVRSTPL